MADTSGFAWYPPGVTDQAELVGMGIRPSKLEGPFQVFDQATETTPGGRYDTVTFGSVERFRVTFGPFTSKQKWRQLRPMISHLQSGGWCFFLGNLDTAFCSFLRAEPSRGATSHRPELSLVSSLVPSADPTGSDVIFVGRQPRQLLDQLVVDSWVDGSSLVTTGGTRVDFSGHGPVFVREIETFPFCRIPLEDRGDDFLIHDNHNNFTLDIPLEIDPHVLEVMAQYLADDTMSSTTSDSGGLNPASLGLLDDNYNSTTTDSGFVGGGLADPWTF